MSGGISLDGVLSVGGGACVSACGVGGASSSVNEVLGTRCGATFQGIVSTPKPIRISTPGAVGDSFVDLGVLGDLTAVEFLYVKSDAPIMLRIGAEEPELQGVGGIFPTLFVGGETLTIAFGLVSVTTTFTAADQSAAQVAARINAACALAGLATPRATVVGGQLHIAGIGTGTGSTLQVTGGTAAAALGFPGTPSDTGAGSDVPVWGTFLAEFGVAGSLPPVPARIQVSGNASVTVVAAGRTTS